MQRAWMGHQLPPGSEGWVPKPRENQRMCAPSWACLPGAAADGAGAPGAGTLGPYKPKCSLEGASPHNHSWIITLEAAEARKEMICPKELSQLSAVL